MKKVFQIAKLFLIIFGVAASLRLSTPAQVRPVYDRGAVGLMQMLKRLNTTASALMIGAHPDDEDTALLAYLARGENARTAYLSLTRGDGGQNIIGPELGEALGVIRTEELLQARRLDGAEQFFTRAYDYGFSKTLEEAKSKWDEKVILCDTVRVIRVLRPLVVIAQFTGTPIDGHGQHQFAGYITPLAVKAAADATQCTQSGTPWQVKKFYVRHRGTGEPTLRINTGKYDPLLGRSYFEIAMEARSQHKSQEQGVLELKGDQFSALALVSGGLAQNRESSIFEGIDTSLTAIPRTFKAIMPKPKDAYLTLNAMAAKSLNEYDPREPTKILNSLIETYKHLNWLLDYDPGVEVRPSGEEVALIDHHVDQVLGKQRELAKDAIRRVIGLQIDALADRETYAPGETMAVSLRTFTANKTDVKVRDAKLIVPERWTVQPAEAPPAPTQGFFRRETGDHAAFFNVTVSERERPTRPYWLVDLRQGDMFRWYGWPETLPFQPATPQVEVSVEVLGTTVKYNVPVEYRFADDIRGEIRRNVNVVPPISAELDQTLMIVQASEKPQVKTLSMNLTSHSTNLVSGAASLNIESDVKWKIEPASKPFELKKAGEKLSIQFKITIPARTKPGSYKIAAIPNIGESFAPPTMYTIAYPHIQTHRFYRRAVTNVNVLDLKIAPVKIGYIVGSGDRVLDAIKQMGFGVETISESELASGDLSKYDTIVVGIRAFQVRPDVVANNTRLLDYARGGGTLIVQYQLPSYAPLAPFSTQMGPRVADENAAVGLVDPTHPIFSSPNKITADDFNGWVQERNLYNFTNFAAEYTGLLESHDAGEAENKGGLVIAKWGKGNYIYCSYSMFRQLPAGVPGAYRLFANLLSLSKSR